jgi:predicted transcriptional regulator
MASKQNKTIILLSIKPIYAEQILNGCKTVEFRKTGFENKVTHVVLYASSPTKAITGYFTIAGVSKDHPSNLWKRFGRSGCISYDLFSDYYGLNDQGVAIEIESAYELCEPVALKELRTDLLPPQSFSYLTKSDFDKLLSVPAQEVTSLS